MRFGAASLDVVGRRFNRRYRERSLLPAGFAVWLRVLQREDGELLRRAFRCLSPDEWRYFLELSSTRHFALVATRLHGGEEALGCARGILTDDGAWEATVSVVEHAQRCGLGRLLLSRLMQAARERDIHTLRLTVDAGDAGMQCLLASVAPTVRPHVLDGNLIWNLPL